VHKLCIARDKMPPHQSGKVTTTTGSNIKACALPLINQTLNEHLCFARSSTEKTNTNTRV